MFTGIVEETGKVKSKVKISEGFRFRVECKSILKKIRISDSISVNGVCQTVTYKDSKSLGFISVHETLKKTNLGELKIGEKVNLESPLRAGDNIGGHFVYGHIDCTGIISDVTEIRRKKNQKSENKIFTIKIPDKFCNLVVKTGSITINGVSLTVAEVQKPKGKHFKIKIAIIPYTLKHTTFNSLSTGDSVNLEFDILGKYLTKIFS